VIPGVETASRRRRRRWIAAAATLGLFGGAAGAAHAGSLVTGNGGTLDHIAFAVDAVESSHGANVDMWRVEPDGPQGPMQVSAAAAADVGGGDRFDLFENRAIGRAYLARLYRRYANWPDAVAAYNWGPGNMDGWIGAGRPSDKFPIAVSLYRIRVLFGLSAASGGLAIPRFGIVHPPPRRSLADRRHPSRQSIAVEQLYGAIMSDSERATR
jgi:Transglycosylase SLT domain